MEVEYRAFGDLFGEPTRNGLNRPKEVRGKGVKMVNMGELFAYQRLKFAAMDRVPLSTSEAEKSLLVPGDLLFARQSLVLEGAGKCSIFLADTEPVTFESHITRVRLDKELADPLFYFYYLQSHHGRAAVRSIVEQGAGASGIRGSDLARLQVIWQPLPIQKSISKILGVLDDKIEINRRLAVTLEEMARAIFKSWFIDFEPVHAKSEGRPTNLPPEIDVLFPDSFADSELGPIPTGWDCQPLSDLADLSKSQINPSAEPDLEYAHYSIPAYDKGRMPVFEAGASILSQKFAVPAGAVLVSKLNPENPRVWLPLEESGITAICSTEFLVLQPRLFFSQSYLYCLTLSDRFRVELTSGVTGTSKSHQRAQPQAVMAMSTIAAPVELVQSFTYLAEPLLRRALLTISQTRKLVNIRDTILPKLISGQIEVPQLQN